MINYDFTYNELLYFLLIFVRVASFVFVAPFFSMGNTPARIRAGLSFFITLLLYHTLPETEILRECGHTPYACSLLVHPEWKERGCGIL